MRVLLIVMTLLLSGWAHAAAEPTYEFEDPNKRALFQELTRELRCPMCQNQAISDSDAMIAHDLRRKVYQLIQQGYDRQQVIDYMKQRYGDFVYYQPPVTATTIWLWLLPLLSVAIGAAIVWRSKSKAAAGNQQTRLAEADKMLESDE